MRKILFAAITFLGLINISCISNDWEDNSVNSAVIEQPISGKFLKNVLIEDLSGDLHLLRYRLILLKGSWKIAGVEFLRTEIMAI